MSGRAVVLASGRGVALGDLSPEELAGLHPLLDQGVRAVLSPEAGVGRRVSPMGTGPEPVAEQLSLARRLLNEPPGSFVWACAPEAGPGGA